MRMATTTATAPTTRASSTPPEARAVRFGAALGWEISKLAAQLRTKAVLFGVLVLPIPLVLIISAQSQAPKDTLFGRYSTTSGFSLALLILAFAGQWALPLLCSLVAGDIFASEDQHGTWKTVLTRSASRSKLYWAKVVAACAFTILMLAVLSVSTIAASVLLGGPDQLTGVSGQLIPNHQALMLVSASWATALIPTLGFTALAIMVSVATRSSAAGVAAPAVLGILMQLAGSLGTIAGLRAVLLSTPYEAWHGLLAEPRFLGPFLDGAVVTAAWVVLCLAISYVLFRRRDITGG